MKILLFILLIAMTLIGCTSSYLVSRLGGKDGMSYQEFNDRVKGKTVRIELLNGRKIEGMNLQASKDSLQWFSESTDSTFGVTVDEIKRVVRKDNWLGALEGFGAGLVAGGAYGFLSVTPENSNNGFFGSWQSVRLIKTLVLGVLGAFTGGIIGMIVGYRYEYQFVRIM